MRNKGDETIMMIIRTWCVVSCRRLSPGTSRVNLEGRWGGRWGRRCRGCGCAFLTTFSCLPSPFNYSASHLSDTLSKNIIASHNNAWP